MNVQKHLHALLLAGGKGTRFWPLSREDHPKQLLKLFSNSTLVEETYDRIRAMIPNDRVMVATSRALATKLVTLFQDIPPSNFIVEPVPRNTAPCIAVAAHNIYQQDPDGIIVVLPSDHFVADQPGFVEVLESAAIHAARGKIVTLGITPTNPETGYGYLRFGEFEQSGDAAECRHRARTIQAFVEKPDQETAVSYLKAGRYLWNSGIFVFRADVMIEKVKLHMPTLWEGVEALSALSSDGAPEPSQRDLIRVWSSMPSTSIDYGIMEKADGIVVIPSSFGWSDVGSWKALSSFPNDEDQNFNYGRVVAVDSRGNVLYSSHGLLATLGLENMVVVVTKGAVLVCPADRTQDVKTLVEEIKNRHLNEYL